MALAAFVLVFCCINAHAEADEPMQVTMPVSFVDVAFASKSTDIFGINAKGLYILAADGSIKKVCPSNDDEEYGRIAVFEDDVWVTVIGKSAVDHYDQDGNLIERKSLHFDDMDEFISVRAYGHYLIFHGYETKSQQVDLWICDLDDGSAQRLGEQNVYSFDISPSGHVYSVTSTWDSGDHFLPPALRTTIKEFDLQGQLMSDEVSFSGSASALCVVDPARYITISDGALTLNNIDSNTVPANLYFFPRDAISRTNISYVDDGNSVRLWISAKPGAVYVVPLSHVSEIVELTVYGYAFSIDIDRFENEHPNVRVQVIEPDYETSQSVKTRILAGDDSIDIINLDPTDIGSRGYVDNGYYVDLYESVLIKQDAAQWLPYLRDVSTHNGELFGYPVNMFCDVIVCNDPSVYEDLSPRIASMDWYDFIDYLDQLKAEGKQAFSATDTWLVGTIQLQCVQMLRDATKEEYRTILNDLLAILKRLEDGGYLSNASGAAMRMDTLPDADKDMLFIGFPAFPGGEAKTPFISCWLAINPYSQNKDLALEFIEEYVNVKERGLQGVFMQLDQLFAYYDESTDDVYQLPKYINASQQYVKDICALYDNAYVYWNIGLLDALFDTTDFVDLDNTNLEALVQRAESRIGIYTAE